MDDDDWDLHAVVRGCAAVTAASASTTAAAATNNPTFPSLPTADQNSFDFLRDDHNINDPFQGLQEAYRELCGDAPPPPTITAAASMPAAHNVFQPRQEMMQVLKSPLQMSNVQSQENIQFDNPSLGSSSSHNFPATNPQPNRQRRRKHQQMKIVRQMSQEELSADSWAWRKYGQKPIKGSPYPRNYYRCSTSKGCAARKQVERSPNDPGLFVVSYTGEHTHPRPTHRSSLAGSTRSKLSSPRTSVMKNNNKGNLNMISSSSPVGFTPSTPVAAAENNDVEMAEEEEDGGGDDDDENIFMIPNDLMMNDDEDLFKGFHDSDDHSSGAGDLFPGGLIASPPWTPTGSAANAATFRGGG
ncbi:WRKY transcription factor 22 [Phtheirospermum japonicum]|uniref:WRKY transcription factor 22 n=1 Tax=Phtheirospermum japonicum TaxID=374723 RepID=A0A830DJW9_9LAMI|nr:WRKY transcription factor 22 [Phtheirospermum japonicum]